MGGVSQSHFNPSFRSTLSLSIDGPDSTIEHTRLHLCFKVKPEYSRSRSRYASISRSSSISRARKIPPSREFNSTTTNLVRRSMKLKKLPMEAARAGSFDVRYKLRRYLRVSSLIGERIRRSNVGQKRTRRAFTLVAQRFGKQFVRTCVRKYRIVADAAGTNLIFSLSSRRQPRHRRRNNFPRAQETTVCHDVSHFSVRSHRAISLTVDMESAMHRYFAL